MIKLGDDFVERIETALASCSVLLALIGDGWLTATDGYGRRRLNLPDDYVRLEIETALARGLRVIPVLVDGARMPRASELPPSISALASRQALTLNSGRFASDVRYLLSALDTALASADGGPRRASEPPWSVALPFPPALPGPSESRRVRPIRGLVVAGVVCCAALGAGGYALARDLSGRHLAPDAVGHRNLGLSPSPTVAGKEKPAHKVRSSPSPATTHLHPSSAATTPTVNPAGETLSATMVPDEITNTGQDVNVVVTVTGATPGGEITWEESARGPIGGTGNFPTSFPCYIGGSANICGVDLKHGKVTADSAGVATIDATFVPGQVYDATNVQNVSDFDSIVWEIDVWDDSTYNPNDIYTNGRSAGCAPGLSTPASTPAPADWSTS